MALYNYGIGGNEVKLDAHESINEIQNNKTLLVAQLSEDGLVQPELVKGLKTVDEVFRHFKPTLNVELTDAEGVARQEQLQFRNLSDFSPKGLIANSIFLNNLAIHKEQYTKIMKQLKTNQVLKSVLAQPEAKASMIALLEQMARELESMPD